METEVLVCETGETEVFEELGDDEVENDVEETKVVDLMSVEGLDDSYVDIDVGMVKRLVLLEGSTRLLVVCEELSDSLSPVEKTLLVVSEHDVAEEPMVSPVVMMIESPDVIDRLIPVEVALVLEMELVWLATMIVVQRQAHEVELDASSSLPQT
ncbi:uncharacterized protein Bfra_006378 [Botrytis fragariae]|uniref:Uncharacterized protein n=1 Tax=Botrytis fragariae TaxID=1964551 RepID=A0A8H6B4B2_9HELO|nr:uncharacterized protein Bfra_006378 [Botrytis fragariae]KAF5879173.1 hypothetical protein Bfra_006378 [Botrytis fragariae]